MSEPMHEHEATVTWSRRGAAFTDNKYSRAHEWRFDGGAVVPASASPHVVPVPFSDPAGVDPEEALVAALSSCHMLTFLWLAGKRGFVVDSYADEAVGRMGENAAGREAVTHVVLRPRTRFSGSRKPTESDLAELHHEAHEQCFIANSVTTEVTVDFVDESAAPADDAAAVTIAPRGAREIVITRAFAAPRARVFEALTKPVLIHRWLLGPPGWAMPVCEVDLRVGGKYRYEWRRGSDGTEMGAGGVFREIRAPDRLVATERFDEPWYPGEALIQYSLADRPGGGTLLTLVVAYESEDARDGVLATPMKDGIAMGYARLDDLLA
jgi:uncharacterized protein YndB with AHSA1/START domain/organic hydroperoxide reductase OsmC/OhrA